MKEEVIDARGADYVTANGSTLRNLIRNTVGTYQGQYKALLERMNNELPDKHAAVALMVSLAGGQGSLTANALFFKACIEKASWLDKEIRDLNTIGQSFQEGRVYRISLADAQRMGL